MDMRILRIYHRQIILAGMAAFSCLALILFLLPSSTASAEGISIAPLKYQANLNGQIKKGAVDIRNNSGVVQNFDIQIRAFRQINDKGELQFYEDPIISAGIIPDYQHFQLKPDATIHLYFQLNGQKLPKKRIFAALLAQATPAQRGYNITPVLRVGTLFLLKNGNGDPPKQGQISHWNVGLFQLGDSVNGSFDFKNTEKGNEASGYFPNFTVNGVGAIDKFSGDLVFPGIERQQSFDIPGSRIGIYKLQLTSDAKAGAEQWVVVLTGYWRWLLPLIIIAVILGVMSSLKLIRHSKHARHDKK